ncbi:SPOR domain-containing protein [Flavobacterium orientale]|uniref:Sporulation protein n=1 Tax=Flavobacterium orientale TaxID=1756020 RepID=A0A917DFP5_9FLAO|nr:SPOR domain-containing protein [Flavobacterium orientale]GGD33860.1 sporulation protein [Flavobacterium orientale]
MNLYNRKCNAIAPILMVFFMAINSTNGQTVTVEQDAQFEQLLSEKRRINASITVTNRWKIQIFTGDNTNSRKALQDFKRDYKTIDATVVFHTPSYKVWVGNFKTRIEAERTLLDLKSKYPDAFLIKPNK